MCDYYTVCILLIIVVGQLLIIEYCNYGLISDFVKQEIDRIACNNIYT